MGLLLYAAIEENYLTEWRAHQREYRRLLLAKAEREEERVMARRVRVEVRQIVVPDLGRVDRCVSCHLGLDDPRMGDVPQPYASHPGSLLQSHDPDKFGCSACHGGQGRATTKGKAHASDADAFWERPLLPAPLTQSSCGSCHDAETLAERGAPLLARGASLFREKGCRGCHKLAGRGGPHGPPLDGAGDKAVHALPFAHVSGPRTLWNWHRQHLEDPGRVVTGSKMPKLALADDELQALTTLLLSLRSLNLTERMTPPDRYAERYHALQPSARPGQELYQEFCVACHEDGTSTVLNDALGTSVPSVRNADFLAVVSDEFLKRSIRDGRSGTHMPAWNREAGGLTDGEIGALVAYLAEARVERREIAFVPRATTDAENGRRIYEASCAECHAVAHGGEACCTWLGSPGFQQAYSDALIGHTTKYGREGTLMNPQGREAGGDLSDQDISDLIAFIRTLK